ncbi:MAG TPA: hypothetical protein VNM16_00920 [Bacillota bacterium]|nr:hypothetical protein [Bacillota bacterium]
MNGEIAWSDHGRDMLVGERSEIGAGRVEDAIRNPDQDIAADDARYPGRRIAHKIIEMSGKSYLLRVFYDSTPTGPRIVSFYRTSPIERYWRPE